MDGALDDFDMRRLKSTLTQDDGFVWARASTVSSIAAEFDCSPSTIRRE